MTTFVHCFTNDVKKFKKISFTNRNLAHLWYIWLDRAEDALFSALSRFVRFLFLALKLGRKSKIDDFRQSFLRIMKVNWFFLSYFERETAIWHQIHARHKNLNRLTHTETIFRDVLSVTGHWALDCHWTWHSRMCQWQIVAQPLFLIKISIWQESRMIPQQNALNCSLKSEFYFSTTRTLEGATGILKFFFHLIIPYPFSLKQLDMLITNE